MVELVRSLRACYRLKVAVVTIDGREFLAHRVKQFDLKKLVDFFIVSCFVHCRKPEVEIYRMALGIAQVDPEEAVLLD
jgi:putative hydrolase of the HAD superfamily